MKKYYKTPVIESSELIGGMLCFQDNSNGGTGIQEGDPTPSGDTNAPKRVIF